MRLTRLGSKSGSLWYGRSSFAPETNQEGCGKRRQSGNNFGSDYERITDRIDLISQRLLFHGFLRKGRGLAANDAGAYSMLELPGSSAHMGRGIMSELGCVALECSWCGETIILQVC